MLKTKFRITILLLAVCAAECRSQSRWEAGLRIMPQVPGFRFNTPVPALDFLKITPSYQRVRTAQGIGLTYRTHPRWSAGADLLYSLQGGGYEARKTTVNCLKIPLLIGYNASPKKKFVFTLQTGIELSYLMSAKMKYSDGETIDIAPYLNKTNLGIPLAAGGKFKVFKTYWLNTQIFASTDFRSLSKTNPSFKVNNYIIPGLRFCIDQFLKN